MDWFILIVGALAMFCAGAAIGCLIEEGRQERIREDDHILAQKRIKEVYRHGYDDGVKTTVALVQEVFGVDLPTEDKDEHHRLENTQETP